jgi:alpha-tubulin suppressor-like RCC1 family protein
LAARTERIGIGIGRTSQMSRSTRTRIVAAILALVVAACADAGPIAPLIPVIDEPTEGRWTAVTVGRDHSCAIDRDQRAFCWGSDTHGQLGAVTDTTCGPVEEGTPCSLVPTAVIGGLRFRTLDAGSVHTCGITTEDDLFCWGANDAGQTGSLAPTTDEPRPVLAGARIVAVSAGADHTCAIASGGTLFCWGSNQSGQLGIEGVSGTPVPLSVPLGEAVRDVATGLRRTCAVTASRTLSCWGLIWDRRDGFLEVSHSVFSATPVPGAFQANSVSVGGFTACAVATSAGAFCWQGNPSGVLGTGDAEGSTTPRHVVGGADLVGVSVGLINACGVTAVGIGLCWGDNTFGQLGIGSIATAERCPPQMLVCSTVPRVLFGRHQWLDVQAGPGQHVCGVTSRGNIYCWGLGTLGQRGDGTASYRVTVPFVVHAPRS